jgi:hypothetical protein
VQPKREERRKGGACIDPHGFDGAKTPADVQDRDGGLVL